MDNIVKLNFETEEVARRVVARFKAFDRKAGSAGSAVVIKCLGYIDSLLIGRVMRDFPCLPSGKITEYDVSLVV